MSSLSNNPHLLFMSRLKLDEAELRSRRAFFEITDDDLARLASLRPHAERWAGMIVDGLYELLFGHPESRAFIHDEATVRRLKVTQKEYFAGLFSGVLDLAYVEDRLRVGAAHARIGLSPKWYIGAYARYLRLIHDQFAREFTDPAQVAAADRSIAKLVHFDMSLALDVYIQANLDTIARHQAAVRELSTPVIRVYPRVLLLPLVGTVDTLRAQQIMETILLRVVEDQAKVVILDIAGVPVVDTKVADHLLETTAAVRLLGTRTVLTGISPHVARTIVQLGVDISQMHTESRLENGIEFALRMVGKEITDRSGAEGRTTERR
jgi:rsbT co-antagonist protein RsbR